MNKILGKFLLVPAIVGLIFPSAGLAQTQASPELQDFLKKDAKKLQEIENKLAEIRKKIEDLARGLVDYALKTSVDENLKNKVRELIGHQDSVIRGFNTFGYGIVAGGPIDALSGFGETLVFDLYSYGGSSARGGTTRKTALDIAGILDDAFRKTESLLDFEIRREERGEFPPELKSELDGILTKLKKFTEPSPVDAPPKPTWIDLGDPPLKDEVDRLVSELNVLIKEKIRMIDKEKPADILDVKTEDKKTGSIKDETGSLKSIDRKYAAARKYIESNKLFFENLAISSGMAVRVKLGKEILATFSSKPQARQIATGFSRSNQVLTPSTVRPVQTSSFARPSVPAYTPTAPTARPAFQYQAPQLTPPSVQYSR